MSNYLIDSRSVAPGTVVTVPVDIGPLTITHPGIVTDRLGPDGLPTIINASKRRAKIVVEETWSSFADGKLPSIQQIASNVSVSEMLRRARADLGERWDLLSANCEHAIRRWRGLPIESPQLRVGVGVGIGLAVVITLLLFGRR